MMHPFSAADGTPFQEVHHTRRLADEGPDAFTHVPSARTATGARFNTDTGGFRKRLEELTAEKEAAVGPAMQADDSSTFRTDTGSAIQAQAPAMV